MPALHAVHDEDPRKVLIKKIGGKAVLDRLNLFGNAILVAIYVPPKTMRFRTMTLQVPDATKKEYEYQGKVGLIVKQGPQAWVEDDQFKFDQKCKVGDWVVFKPSDGWQLTVTNNQTPCRILRESSIIMTVDSPDDVW